jgi:6-phosphogluconolactonase (cycloisomerase 2 family)
METSTMKKLALVVSLSIPLFIAACTKTTTIGHAYFVSPANNSIYDYSIRQNNSNTGSTSTTENTLTLLSTLALPATGTDFSLATDLAGKYLLVANNTTGALSTYTINDAGALSTAPVATLNSPSGTNPTSLTIDSTGRYVYVANSGTSNNSITEYTIGSTGALSLNTTLSLSNTTPNAIVSNPNKQIVYVLTGNALISTYAISSTDGALSLASTSESSVSAEGAYDLAISPNGQYAYVASTSGIHEYSIGSDGGLTEVSTPVALATGTAPYTIAVDPTNQFVYITNTDSTNISIYSIGTNGALTYQSAIAGAASDITSLAVNNRTEPQAAS